MLERISREGLEPQVYNNTASLTEFNRRSFNLASRANYLAQCIGDSERELRRVLRFSLLDVINAGFGTTAFYATVFQLAEAYKALKGHLSTVESKANLALKKVNQDRQHK